MNQKLALNKVLPAIPCGILWWHGFSLAWVMILPLLWIFLSGERSRVKESACFLGTAVLSYILVVPVAFYLFIPKKGTGRILGDVTAFLLALGVMAMVAFWQRKQKPSLWQSRWWRVLLAGFSALVIVAVLVPIVASLTGGKANRAKLSQWISANARDGSLLVLAKDAGIETEALTPRFNVAPMGVEQLNPRKISALSAVYDELFLISPQWKVIGMNPVAKRAVTKWQNIAGLSRKELAIQGTDITVNPLYPEPVTNPAMTIYRVPKLETTPLTVLRPWRRKAENPGKTSPALHSLGMRGTFKMEYHKEDFNKGDKGNILTVFNRAPNKKGERICQIGYTANKRGLILPVRPGGLVHFIVEVQVPGRLVNKENYVFIQDYNGVWERRSVQFQRGGWMTLLVSKRIRRGSSRLLLGIRFLPESTKDKLRIRNAYIIYL